MSHLPAIVVLFFQSQSLATQSFIQKLMFLIHSIPGMIVFLWVGQVSESNVIFSEHTVAPSINQV
jgi:hypothetical protein